MNFGCKRWIEINDMCYNQCSHCELYFQNKEEQKQLLIEMMQDDEKDGLYLTSLTEEIPNNN